MTTSPIVQERQRQQQQEQDPLISDTKTIIAKIVKHIRDDGCVCCKRALQNDSE